MEDFRKNNIQKFAEWARQNVKGDEKGEAQIYLDRLFQAFGQSGCLDVGGHTEFRLRKATEDGGGIAFADYVWKPVVLIEMKRRGTDLNRHYRQAFVYWTRLAPGRPQYVVLCNFDEFWIYDFDSAQLDTPVDKVSLEELPNRYRPLAFLFPTQETPEFGNYHEAVTRKAADLLAVCFNKLILRVERPLAQRFILQMLVALFAKDTGLLESDLIVRLLDDCHKPSDSYDLIGGLFVAMNTPERASGGRFRGVDYFNGGIFAEPARIELLEEELNQLRQAARSDWSKVRPDIFGTLFEHSMGKEKRRALGGHYTSPADIMKIVEPTIARPWREQIDSAKTLAELRNLLVRMHGFTVLDAACGSGNFLYMAYRELKRLEARIFERIAEMSARTEKSQLKFGFVTARQFFGIDIVPFAVELAKVTMMIGRKLAIDELHVTEPALPLDNLDANFIVGDALLDDLGNVRPWPKADVIIGNPPFVGAKGLKPQWGAEYVNRLRKAYPEVPGMADYCVYWFRRAHDHLSPCTKEDPVTGRAGLVGTQNIRNNQSRVGALDHVVKTGTIIEAVDNQPWSGEANVHVSIVNWVKTQDPDLLPPKRMLWSKSSVPQDPFKLKTLDHYVNPAARRFELAGRGVSAINAALSDQVDVKAARILRCNTVPQRIFRGLEPGNMGFLLSPAEARRLIERDPKSAEVIRPYLTGRELLTGNGTPERWLIDFQRLPITKAMSYPSAFAHVKRKVLPQMQVIALGGKSGRKIEDDELRARIDKRQLVARMENWWQLRRCVPETVVAVQSLPRYIACSLVTKRPVFVFLSNHVRPSNLVQSFAFPDDYSFSILQSNTHWQWFVAKCSKLKSDFRYTPESVFDTFPWPQGASAAQVRAVAQAGCEVRRIRAEALEGMTGGLRALYRTLELPGKNPLKDAHAALDAAVLDAYGFSAKKGLLVQLLELNLSVAARIEAGQPVTAPGVPPSYGDASGLITDDCIRP